MAIGKMYKSKARPYTAPVQKVIKKAKAVNENFKKRVKRAVGQFRDRRYLFFNDTVSIDNSGAYLTTPMSQTTQGDGTYGNRQGDTITPTRLHVRWSWAYGDPEYNQCRWIIFQWRPDDNSLPPTGAVTNIINSSSLGTSAAPLSQVVFDQKNFHILYDSLTHVVGAGTSGTADGRMVTNGQFTIFGKKMSRIRYTNGVSAGHNNIYVLAITDSAVAPHPQLIVSATLEYDA